jgi:hypothetical protein
VLGVGRGGRHRGAHELGDEVAEHADEDHDHGERDKDPVPGRRVEHQLLRHRRREVEGSSYAAGEGGGWCESSPPGWARVRRIGWLSQADDTTILLPGSGTSAFSKLYRT